MGTCMSKDKKGVAPVTASISSSSSSSASSSLTSQSKQIFSLNQAAENTNSKTQCSAAENIGKSFPITIARPSVSKEGRDLASTDKHVVDIRLPIASPNKYNASPAFAIVAAKAVAAIASRHTGDEEQVALASQDDLEDESDESDEEEGSYVAASKLTRNSLPPLFYSSYLTGASFSQDLAAFSRDLVSLSSSPLKKSPSVNGVRDLSTATHKGAHSPCYTHSKTNYNMLCDEYSTTTRSRSLPKRFYGKDSHARHHPMHKRSSSRDAAMGPEKPFKRKSSADPSSDVMLSPRLFVRREEASGEYRVRARQAAARKHHQQGAQISDLRTAEMGQCRNKERSPLRKSFMGKVADGDPEHLDAVNLQYSQDSVQAICNDPTTRNQMRARSPLKDMPVNSSPIWDNVSNQGPKGSLKKVVRNKKCTKMDGRIGLSVIENVLFEGGARMETSPESSLRCPGKPSMRSSNEPDEAVAGYPTCMDRVRSFIEALAEMNMESSLLSEVEESETEVEGELDLLHFAFKDRFSPEKELQAQQARNMLLKEAAMDAFARPSLHSTTPSEGLEEAQLPSSELAALVSMRLTDAEADSVKIRRVLKLLSLAESEMGKEQKALFYNQLRMVLDSVKAQPLADSSNALAVAKGTMGSMRDKAMTARANSWPRSMKEPPHAAMRVESESNELLSQSTNRESALMDMDKTLEKHEILPRASLGDELQNEILVDHHLELENKNSLEADPDVREDNLEQMLCNDLNTSDKSNHMSMHMDEEQPGCELLQQDDKQKIFGQPNNINAIVGNEAAGTIRNLADEGLIKNNHAGSRAPRNNEGHADDLMADTEFAASESVHADGLGSNTLVTSNILYAKAYDLPQLPLREMDEMRPLDLHSDGIHRHEPTINEEHTNYVHVHPLAESSQQWKAPECTEEDVHCNIPSHDEDVIGTFLNSSKSSRPEDAGSDGGSFEFYVRSSASTPLSTPSTPMISTASTPRHLNPALTVEEIAEIWEAFE